MTVLRYVNTAAAPGGDGTTNLLVGANRAYASLNEFEAGEQAVLSDDMVCYCEGTSADTTAVNIGGWTTTSVYTLTIKTAVNKHHGGKWDTLLYRLECIAGSDSLFIYEHYVIIDGLQVTNSGTGISDVCISCNGYRDYITIKNCIVKGGYCGIQMIVTGVNGGHNVYNNIVYNTVNNGIEISASSAKPSTCYNNTVYNCNTSSAGYRGGIKINGGITNTTVKNCVALSNGNKDFDGGTQSYNISSDATASGTGSLTSRTATASTSPGAGNWVMFKNITSSTEDFHLQVHNKNNAIGAGIVIDDIDAFDIDGDVRFTPWDIGADQWLQDVNPDVANKFYISAGLTPTDSLVSATANTTYLSAGLTAEEIINFGGVLELLWQTKPYRGVQLNKSHPLSRGLVSCHVFNEETGQVVFDLARNLDGQVGSAISRCSNGLQFSSTYLDSNSVVNCDELDYTGWSGVTVVCDLEFQGNSGEYPGLVTNIPYGNYINGFALTVEEVQHIFWRCGTVSSRAEILGLNDGDKFTVVGSWDETEQVRRIYKDGVFVDSESTASSFPAFSNNLLRIGGYYYSGDRSYTGEIYHVYIYNRKLTDDEVREISDNPYQIFEPTPVPFYIGVGGVTIRELISLIAATTGSTGDIAILRELASTIAAQTVVGDITLLAGIVRDLISTIAAVTTSSGDVKILRDIESIIAATTTSAGSVGVLREMQSVIDATTTSTATIKVLREMESIIAASTASTADISVLREYLSTIAATTGSTAAIEILRELTSTVSAVTTVGDIELLISGVIELISTISAQTVVADAPLKILREISSVVAAGTTLSQIDLITATLRELVSTINATTTVSDVEMLVLREIVSTVDVTTSLDALSLTILREIESTIEAETTVSQIDLITATLRELISTIAATTAVSNVDVDVLRNLSSTVTATTDSTADIKIERLIESLIEAEVTVGDVNLIIGGLLNFMRGNPTISDPLGTTLTVTKPVKSTVTLT